jgi:hypothetical protein
VGAVRFDFLFLIRTTGRRLKSEGVVGTAMNYAANGLSILFTRRPLSHRYSDVREA